MKYILLGFFLRFLVAIWNGFFGPSIGAEGDALMFHEVALYVSNTGVFEAKYNIGWIYSIFLGVIYYLTLDSIFIGSLLSCFAWFISAVILNKSIQLLGIHQKYRNRAMLLYAIIPSSILFTSVTLREVYQLLFVNTLIYSSLMILIKKNSKYWFLLAFSALTLGLLHFGLVLYALLVALLTFYFTSIRQEKIFSLELIIFYIPAITILSYGAANLFTSIVPFDFSDGLAATVEAYQMGHNESRAMYIYKPEINGLFDLFLFMPISLLQYLLEPMPWRIATSLDLALFLENIIRCLFIFFAIRAFFTIKKSLKTPLIFLILIFLALEMLWALGTVNWGSAVRHHIPGMGILMIIGVCFLDPNLHIFKNTKKLPQAQQF
jgi:hypothetical protein